MKHSAEIGSGATIYIPSFMKIGQGIQKLMEWGDALRDTDTQDGDRLSILYENRLMGLKKIGSEGVEEEISLRTRVNMDTCETNNKRQGTSQLAERLFAS
jgi:hypothetical protein